MNKAILQRVERLELKKGQPVQVIFLCALPDGTAVERSILEENVTLIDILIRCDDDDS